VHGYRPSVNSVKPDLRINVHVAETTCTVSLDSSGESLHKRGYRTDTNEAPISEVLAAGMILLSGWDKKTALIDPMCGSGTIIIEAALIAHKIPPGIYRKQFGFETWKDFDVDLFEEIFDEEQTSDFKGKIYGADVSRQTLIAAAQNIKNASLQKKIVLTVKSFEKLDPPEEKGFMIVNPPYGERMSSKNINNIYSMIGERLKHHFSGYTTWIISNNNEALKNIGLRPSKKINLHNGPLECKFQRFDLYKGSKKDKYNKPNNKHKKHN